MRATPRPTNTTGACAFGMSLTAQQSMLHFGPCAFSPATAAQFSSLRWHRAPSLVPELRAQLAAPSFPSSLTCAWMAVGAANPIAPRMSATSGGGTSAGGTASKSLHGVSSSAAAAAAAAAKAAAAGSNGVAALACTPGASTAQRCSDAQRRGGGRLRQCAF
jgi:hypothetical protein